MTASSTEWFVVYVSHSGLEWTGFSVRVASSNWQSGIVDSCTASEYYNLCNAPFMIQNKQNWLFPCDENTIQIFTIFVLSNHQFLIIYQINRAVYFDAVWGLRWACPGLYCLVFYGHGVRHHVSLHGLFLHCHMPHPDFCLSDVGYDYLRQSVITNSKQDSWSLLTYLFIS